MPTENAHRSVPQKAAHWHVSDDTDIAATGKRLRSLLTHEGGVNDILLCVTAVVNPDSFCQALSSFVTDDWRVTDTSVDRESTADDSAVLWLTLSRTIAGSRSTRAPGDGNTLAARIR